MSVSNARNERLYSMSLASVYPAYLNKMTRKGRTEKELIETICWLTKFTPKQLESHLKKETTLRDFFSTAKINPLASGITGSICGVKIAEIEDPLMKKIRYLDKLIDDLAKGKSLEKVFFNE